MRRAGLGIRSSRLQPRCDLDLPGEGCLSTLGLRPRQCPPWQAREQGIKNSDILGPAGDMMSEVGRV